MTTYLTTLTHPRPPATPNRRVVRSRHLDTQDPSEVTEKETGFVHVNVKNFIFLVIIKLHYDT